MPFQFTCRFCGIQFSNASRRAHPYCSIRCRAEHVKSDRADRFWSRVDKSGDCWLWRGALHPSGYGYTGFKGGERQAHRYSYFLAHGAIPEGLLVLHRCDVRPCVRPAHLFLGTITDNMADKFAKGRQLRGESIPQSKLTAADVAAIRRRYAEGGISMARLGATYGVNHVSIRNIVRGLYWKHVDPYAQP